MRNQQTVVIVCNIGAYQGHSEQQDPDALSAWTLNVPCPNSTDTNIIIKSAVERSQ